MTIRKMLMSLAVAASVGAAGAWTDISAQIAARETAWEPTGAAVDDTGWSGSILAFASSVKDVEYVTNDRPFDSLSFTLGISDFDRFYSVYRPGVLLFIR